MREHFPATGPPCLIVDGREEMPHPGRIVVELPHGARSVVEEVLVPRVQVPVEAFLLRRAPPALHQARLHLR